MLCNLFVFIVGVSLALGENTLESFVPDIIDVVPTSFTMITYPSGAKVNKGNELTPTAVKDIPKVEWLAENDELYTLLLTDPDAPSRENATLREVRHWLVINIPKNNISQGNTLFEYIGSGPPKGTGLHRYLFLIFKQPHPIESDIFVSNRSRKGRLRTSTKSLINDFNLGNPIAANFYQAQFDDYVPILHKQLE